ncbi:transglutaminase-like domain-containing protein [Microbacterium sp. W1N]|uniref:transglutaminase-like domain-containing protein n=1 Tax=Microbacterium festucae TaxID=2977531 RepID=UPI0021C049A7|nr:transglutaminase-like domain-containing protein [Microbacterium festucae]MCT9819249.1 transglutaminase-like domain-containing protein [Microbacterium festucae]
MTATTTSTPRASRFGLSAIAVGTRSPLAVIVDLVAVAALLTVSIIGFGPTFDGPGYLVAGFGALVIGLALAWVGARWRWGVASLAGATVGAYFLFGGALALPTTTLVGVIPTLETWRRLAVGTVTSYKQLLTTVPPVAASDGHLIVPFLLVLVAAVLAGSLALRAVHPAWALLPAVALLIGQILLGVSQPAAPFLQGAILAAVSIAWLAVRQLWVDRSAAVRIAADDARAPLRRRRLIAGSLVLLIAAAGGAATAAYASPPTARYILRDFVVPPFDIRDYPSPLQAFRGMVRDDAETALFTASGLPDEGRVRLATMDAYDGVVYNVSDAGAGSSSAFTPVRSNMSPDAEGDLATVRFEIGDLGGVWLPDVGSVREIDFDGDQATALRQGAHYNDATGTAVVTTGLVPGDAYTIETVIPTVPSDSALAEVPFAPLKMPTQEGVPESLAELGSKAIADAETPIERARALESWLQTDGFFSHGLADDVYSPSGHGTARMISLFGGDQLIGDDEQYAVAMTLIARQLGMPARVVMGWYPDEDEQASGVFTATGDNLHAWVEIAFTGVGWVPFDPTPDEDNQPSEQNTQPRANPKPQVLQPPPPAQEPADLPPAIAEDRDQNDEDEQGAEWIGAVLAWVGGSLLVLLVLASPFIVMGIVKGSRRTKRRTTPRTADRISGGWDELVDNAVDLRVPVDAGVTRAESAAAVGAAFAPDRVGALATRADADVYGPGDPSVADVEAFWREVDEIVGGMKEQSGFWARVRARLSLRSLRRGYRPRRGGADAGEK